MKHILFSSRRVAVTLSIAAMVPVSAFAQDDPAVEAPAAPAPAAVELKDPVATVNGKNISKTELQQNANAFASSMGASMETLPAPQQIQVYHRVLDDMVIDSLLEEKAKDVNVTDKELDEAYSKLVAQFPDQAAFEERLKEAGDTEQDVKDAIKASLQKRDWIESRLPKDIAATEAAAKAFYEQNAESFNEPAQVRASHVLIATPADLSDEQLAEKEKLALDIKARIDKGEDFATLAGEFSDDPGAKVNGGDLDFFTKDRMVPEFADAAFTLEVDAVSAPVKSQFGYHIIKKTDSKEARTVPFDEAKPQLIEYLSEQKRREAIQQLLQALRTQSDVKVNLPPVPSAPSAPAALQPAADKDKE